MSGETTIADESPVEYPLLYVVRRVARPHLPAMVVGTVASFCSTSLNNLSILVIGIAFDTVFSDTALSLPLVPGAWIPETQVEQLWFLVGLWLAVSTLGVAAAFLKEWYWSVFGLRVVDDVRVDTFESAQRQKLSFFDRYRTGNLMSVFNNDVNSLETALRGMIRWSLLATNRIASALVFMALLNWQLTLLVATMIPALVAVNYWFANVLERLYDVLRETTGALNGRIETSLAGISVIKAFGAEGYEGERLREASEAYRDDSWDVERISIRKGPTVTAITGATIVVTMLVGGLWIIDGPPLFFAGTLTAGQLVPFLFYMRDMDVAIDTFSDIVDMYKGAKASAKRVVGVRDADHRRDVDGAGDPLDVADGDVEYDGVSFRYPTSDELVIDDVSFAVEAGETVGVVGATGAGKSTLLKLLMRLYSPGDGTISIDGRDIGGVPPEDLRGAIGYVDQDPFLFDGTVHENIAYGAARETTDDAVEIAAREAGAHEFIEGLPEGYDTTVGQRGVKLSGGQRQRVSIARAVVGDPEILVFDEATSHVDNETEVLIQQNLEALAADRTTFVIAHRLSTVRNADRILVLGEGELVEQGTHEALLDRDGAYAKLWYLQIGEIEKLPDAFADRVMASED